MKKVLSVLCVVALLLAMTACSNAPAEDETPIVNPINLSFSLIDGEDDLDIEDFPEIQRNIKQSQSITKDIGIPD